MNSPDHVVPGETAVPKGLPPATRGGQKTSSDAFSKHGRDRVKRPLAAEWDELSASSKDEIEHRLQDRAFPRNCLILHSNFEWRVHETFAGASAQLTQAKRLSPKVPKK